MGFDINKLKTEITKTDENSRNAKDNFINAFRDIIDSPDFEDWLQRHLEAVYKDERRLYICMGVSYFDTVKEKIGYYFFLGGDGKSSDRIANIKLPIKATSYSEQLKDCTDAISECWKLLKERLRLLGIQIVSSEPKWSLAKGRIKTYIIRLSI